MNLIHYRLLLIFSIFSTTAFAQTASFTADKLAGCVPLVVKFTNTSTPSTGLTYRWSFGNGNTSTLKDPEVIFTADAPGYTVKLEISTNGGTSYISEFSSSITPYKNPTALFTVDNRKGCTLSVRQFTDQSIAGTGTINKWEWDFRTGTQKTEKDPTYDYPNPGIYNVYLKVTDTNGCFSEKDSTDFMDIGETPVASFLPDPPSDCQIPANITFTNTSTGGGTLSYIWDFGDGDPTSSEMSPTHAFKSFGDKDVKLSVHSDYNCDVHITDRVSIIKITADGTISDGMRVLNKSGDNACPGTVLTFTNNSTGTSDAAWDFGDGTGLDYNPNTVHSYAKGGTYTVTLFASPNKCTDKTTWTFNVDNVSALFTIEPKQSCHESQKITIVNQSENAVSYFWEFKTATSSTFSTDKTPSVTTRVPAEADAYELHGEYITSFILTATSATGCTSTQNQTTYIKRPTASFFVSAVAGCVPLKVKFTNDRAAITKEDPLISIYRWEFGDGKDTTTHDEADSTFHTFTAPGEFNARLIITNDEGCKDTSYTVQVRAGTVPHPDFSVSPSNTCSTDIVTITDLTPAADHVDAWYYSVNGQGVSAGSLVSSPSFKIKSSPGDIPIRQVVSYNGCTAEKTKPIAFHNNGPLSNFTYNLDCATPFTINFKGESDGGNAYKWDFGDGSPAVTSLNVTHTYATVNNFTVKFISFNGSCKDTAIQIVHIRQKGAQFTAPSSACANQNVEFAGTASLIQSSICGEKYIWNFNDNTPIIRTDADTVIHQFAHRGTYQIHLTALYDNGCTDTISKAIRIYEPRAGFTSTDTIGCSNLWVTFTDTSKTDGFALKRWEWRYTTGSNVTIGTPAVPGNKFKHEYTPGQYLAQLVVTDDNLCTSKAVQAIRTDKPNADFNDIIDYKKCSGDTIFFTRKDLTVEDVLWNFDENTIPSSSTTSNSKDNPIKHVYTEAGDYNVKLTVVKYGCSQSITKPGMIKIQKPNAGFSLSGDNFTCYNPAPQVVFTHSYPSLDIDGGKWSFGYKQTIGDYESTKYFHYPQPGVFTAMLWVKTSYNCYDTAKHTITVTGPTADIVISKPLACLGDNIELSMQNPQDVVSYKWDLGDGNVGFANQTPVNHQYTSTGEKKVTLLLSNASCTDAPMSTTLTIDEVIAKFSVADTIVCSEKPVAFTNASTGQNSQTWTFGDGVTSSASNPSHNFAAGNYNVILDAVNTVSGCSSQASKIMTVNQTPKMTLTYDKSKCPENKALLIATGGETVNWTPTEGLSSNNTYSVIATPKVSTKYYATVTSKYATSQCTNTDSMMVTRATVEIAPSRTSLPVGDTVQISLYKSADVLSYTWKPETGVSCTTCPNPVIRPYDSVYYMIVTEPALCFSDTTKIHFKLDVNDLSIIAPTAFRPGDPVNGTFKIVGKGVPGAKEFKLEIYNRWGNLVFSSNDASLGWDGLYNGHEQPIDTYVWIATLKLFDGSGQVKKGTVLLQH